MIITQYSDNFYPRQFSIYCSDTLPCDFTDMLVGVQILHKKTISKYCFLYFSLCFDWFLVRTFQSTCTYLITYGIERKLHEKANFFHRSNMTVWCGGNLKLCSCMVVNPDGGYLHNKFDMIIYWVNHTNFITVRIVATVENITVFHYKLFAMSSVDIF